MATMLVCVLLAIFVLLLRFIQPRALYGARHVLLLTESRRLFLRKLNGQHVSSEKFVKLLAKEFREFESFFVY